MKGKAGKKAVKIIFLVVILLTALVLSGCAAVGDDTADGIFSGLLGIDSSRSESVNILMLLTVLSLLPSILIMLTGFTRIIIVLSLVRNGMGTQQMPPNQVMVGLALFLTFFVMYPVITQVKTQAYEPYVKDEITQQEAIDRAMMPIREFMLGQTYTADLKFFLSTAINNGEDLDPESYNDIPAHVLIPAFITSEIKRGFQIGFFIYIPFIVIDMIVASTLMAMGMMMLPPIVISLPFKILLFVLVDGWTLTVRTLLASFGL